MKSQTIPKLKAAHSKKLKAMRKKHVNELDNVIKTSMKQKDEMHKQITALKKRIKAITLWALLVNYKRI